MCGAKLKPHVIGFSLIAITQYLLAIYLGFLLFLYREIWMAVVLVLVWGALDYIRLGYVPFVKHEP